MAINHRPVKALCDSGCVATSISEKFARKLGLQITPSDQSIKLVSANQTSIENMGNADIEICIQGLTIPYRVMVLKNLVTPVVLGQDFFLDTNSVINYGSHTITMNLFDNLICAPLTPQSHVASRVKLSQSVVIPPRTEALIHVDIPKK